MMGYPLLRLLLALASLICFIAICIYAYSQRAKTDFEKATQLPFIEKNETDPVERNKK